MKREGIIILIVILSLLVIALINVLIISIENKDDTIWFGDEIEKNKENIFKEENADILDVENIKINFRSSDIKIIITDEEQLRVVQYASNKNNVQNTFQINKSGDLLEIKENFKHRFYLFYMESISYDIYIPKTYSKSLEIISTSSDIECDKFELENLKIKLTSGDLEIKETINAKNSNIQTVSGEIDINNLSCEKTKLESTSGDIEIRKISSDIDIKTVSGEIEIEEIEGKISAETTSGDISINKFGIYGNSNIKTTSGDLIVYFSENSDCIIETKTVSGDVSLPNGKNTIGSENKNVFKTDTVSGDIKLYIK